MKKIIYRLTLDTKKAGVQKTLQGIETADNMARQIAISLVSGSDSLEIDCDNTVAMMYMTTPYATEPSINECEIKDNVIYYDLPQIVEEGITGMQVKLVKISHSGAKSVLAAPRFALEVTESETDDGSAEQTTTFTALENAVSKASAVYNSRLVGIEITKDCKFRAYYADGTIYENGYMHDALYNGNALLSESFAHGNTGVREGEDTDNSMYYSELSRLAKENAIEMTDEMSTMLEESRLLSNYTSFVVNFETGELGYASANCEFKVDEETGKLLFEGDNTFDARMVAKDDIENYIEAVGTSLYEFVLQKTNEIDSLVETKNNEVNSLISTTQNQVNGFVSEASKTIDTKLEEVSYEVRHFDIATSNEQTLQGSKKGGYRLNELLGNTEQKTLSGKNLLNARLNKDIGANDVYVIDNVQPGETYTLSLCQKMTAAGSRKDAQHWYRYKDADGKTLKEGAFCQFAFSEVNQTLERSTNFVIPENAVSLTLDLGAYYAVGVGPIVQNIYAQLELGDTATEIEPYCGGTPAPNPTYPIAIENVGDCVEMIQGYYPSSTGTFTTNTELNRVCFKNKLPCKAGDVVKVVTEQQMTSMTVCYFLDNTYTSVTKSVTATDTFEMTVPNGVNSFVISFYNQNGLTPQTVGKITLTINGKYVVPIVESGKNLIDESRLLNCTNWSYANGYYTGPSNDLNDGLRNVIDIEFEEDTQYTLSMISNSALTTSNVRFSIKYADGTTEAVYIGNSLTDISVVHTTKANKTVSKIDVAYSSNDTVHIKNFQIEEGIEVTSYEPYTEHVEYIYLDEPLRKVGDVADRIVRKDGVVNDNRKIKTIDLGTLTWTYDEIYKRFKAGITGKTISYGRRLEPMLCEKYIAITDGLTIENVTNYSIYTDKTTVFIHDSDYTDATEFTSAISGTMLYYILAEETFTPLDTESQKAINRLKTFDTVTYIEVDSKIQPSGISGEYGTSQVGAYTLQALSDNDIDRIEREELKTQLNTLSVALVSLGSEVANV